MKVTLAIDQARRLADKIVAELAPMCDRIEVAGSIRRRMPTVGDIEIVAVPKRETDLLGRPAGSLLDPLLAGLVHQRRLVRGRCDGERYKQFGIPAMPGLNLDLFLVCPETWGVLYAIRTGSAEFAQACVTERCRGGRLRDGLVVHHGRVWRRADVLIAMLDGPEFTGAVFEPNTGARPLDTPEERDFLDLAGGWIEPDERSVRAPIREPRLEVVHV